MGLADYNKKFDFKDFFYLFFLAVGIELTLLLAFMLDKNIRILIWKYSLLLDGLCILLLLVNKVIKSNIIYTIATFINPSFRALINLALVILIRFVGFSYYWFIPFVIIYCFIYLLILFPADKLDKINEFFLDSKLVSDGLFLLLIFSAWGNSRYAIRYKDPESFSMISGAFRLGIGLLIMNYYFMVLAVTTIKKSYKKFDDEKSRNKGFVEEL